MSDYLKPGENFVHDALWDGVLAIVEKLPSNGNTRRSIGEFTEDGMGGSAMRATYSVKQDDGTHKVFQLTLSCEESTDHEDGFWGPGGTRDGDDPAKRVVVAGEHYVLGDDKPDYPKAFKGFGGRRFAIEFLDGRRIVTHDLWHQGVVPPKWRERYPNNARFVQPGGAS
ncbi:hypothetical protein AB0I27_23060 [Streptomyces sp. NPDC050597]|uniref:hypothetical protein n=1 Tax=Streptomyces sp. NPDC050597 TaxID=3157212 RepID=UPI0034377ED0